MAREYAISKGYEVVADVSEDDKGASGSAFELEGLTRIREMAAAGSFDVLIPRELDRLSRNLAKQLIVEEELRRAGVNIEYVLGEYPDTPEGDFMKHVKAVVAEYERAKTAERTARARLLKARDGQVVGNGGPPYGYRLEKDGNRRTVLVVYEPEAQIVRLMFIWYIYGDGESGPMSYRAIARRLNEMGVPTWADTHWKCGRERLGGWWAGAVTSILQNETYIGTWRYAGVTVQVPAIVGQDTWEEAKAGKKDKTRRKVPRKYEYLLAGRVRCGLCNKAVAGSGKTVGISVL